MFPLLPAHALRPQMWPSQQDSTVRGQGDGLSPQCPRFPPGLQLFESMWSRRALSKWSRGHGRGRREAAEGGCGSRRTRLSWDRQRGFTSGSQLPQLENGLEKQTLQNRNWLTDFEQELMVTRVGAGSVRGQRCREFSIDMYTLL